MGVATFNQPAYISAANGNVYCAEIEAAVSVLGASFLGAFAPYASTPPDMKVNIGAGDLTFQLGLANGGDNPTPGAAVETSLVSVAAQATANLTAPTSNPRIDRVYVNALSGSLGVVTGAEAISPAAPAYPDGIIPICQVSLAVGQTVITGAHITDERGSINAGASETASGADTAAFNSSVNYVRFTSAGTYNVTKPYYAQFMRVSLGGGGGGKGGRYTGGGGFGGGGGGGGGVVQGALLVAADCTIVVGAQGNGGADGAPATAGNTGGNSTFTVAVSGAVLTANGGGGGGPGTAVAGGGGGGGGTVSPSALGFTGSAGGTGGPIGGGNPSGDGGNAGELQSLCIDGAPSTGDGKSRVTTPAGFCLIEWL